jgi:ankyrin repeat protein
VLLHSIRRFLPTVLLFGALFPVFATADVISDLGQIDKLIRLRQYENAITLLEPLVKQNNGQAQLRMASLLRVGKGVKADLEKAMDLYEKSSLNGVAEAQYTYAIMLEKRLETDQEKIYFYRWLQSAAEQGHARAIQKLALLDDLVENDTVAKVEPDYIFESVRHNEIARVRSLVQLGVNFDMVDPSGRTPLMNALLDGNKNMAKLLLPVTKQLDQSDIDKNSAIHIATRKGFKTIVTDLILRGIDINAVDGLGNTALIIATRHNRSELVDLLLNEGINHQVKNQKRQSATDIAQVQNNKMVIQVYRKYGVAVSAKAKNPAKLDLATFKANLANTNSTYPGWPLLHVVSLLGEKKFVQELINQGVNLNAVDPKGNTALHRAASEGRIDIVKLLLKNGSDINAINRDNETALYFAAASGRVKTISYLINKGASTSVLTKTKSNALLIAIQNGHEASALKIAESKFIRPVVHEALLLAIQKKMTKLCVSLIGKDNLLGKPDADNRTPIWHSSNLGLKTVTTELLKRKAGGINLKDSSGYSALARAVLNRYEDIAVQLIKSGADIHSVTNEKSTLLMLAVSSKSSRIASLIIVSKVDLDAQDNSGDTALIKAASAGDKFIVELLLKTGANPQLRNLNEINAFQAATNAGKEDVAESIKQHSGTLFKLFN